MGKYFDFGLKLEGTGDVMKPALKAIEEFRKEWNEGLDEKDSFFIPKPKAHDGHVLLWFYGKGGNSANDLNTVLLELTKGSALVVWSNCWTTDGDWGGWLQKFENGEVTVDEEWPAAIEVLDAIACFRFRAAPTAEDLAAMIERIKLAISDGWGEDDLAWLMTAAEVSREIFRGLSVDHSFRDEPGTREMLAKLKKHLTRVRADLKSLYDASDGELREIDGLLAVMEAHEIGASTLPGKRAKKRQGF